MLQFPFGAKDREDLPDALANEGDFLKQEEQSPDRSRFGLLHHSKAFLQRKSLQLMKQALESNPMYLI